MNGLNIGDVAKQADVHIETLRYYERRGLVARPPRTMSNYRLSPADAVRRVRYIKRAQELGFSLKEIQKLLSLRATPKARCTDVRERALEAVEKLPRLSVLSTRKGIPNSEITEKSGAKPVLKSLDAMINSVSFRVYQQLLTLAESKTLLRTLQEVMVKHQVQEFVETHHQCP
jgi:DNA-binding transcriptional MerR regulator